MTKKQKYPIGIQSFEELRTGNYLYIDKTESIFNLIDSGKYYFLSRPRRFGKSLTLETLKAIFQGKKHLFSELYIENKIEWKEYPIIHISFTNIGFVDIGLSKGIVNKLQDLGKIHHFKLEKEGVGELLEELILKLYEKYQEKVVILIDEYDTPLVHYLPDNVEEAKKNREILKSFYSCIKGLDEKIRFFFLTGITQFSQMSLFSTLNNLANISMRTSYSDLCGYTQAEMEQHFGDRVKEIASKKKITEGECWDKIKEWYNGFNFAMEEGKAVYNPFSILNFMESGTFDNYWFSSGTPTFLIKMLTHSFVYQIDNVEMSLNRIKSFDLERLDYGALLYQTGYITIKENLLDSNNFFLMGYPNWEVKDSMLQWILGDYINVPHGEAEGLVFQLKAALMMKEEKKIETIVRSFFSKIPTELFKSSMENFYHAITFLMFELLGCKMNVEVSHAHGRMDAVVETEKYIYIFEFKLNRSAKAAIKYIYKQKYYEPFLYKNKPIFLVGVNFTEKAKGVAHFAIENFQQPT